MPPTRIVQYYSKFETGTSGTWLWIAAVSTTIAPGYVDRGYPLLQSTITSKCNERSDVLFLFSFFEVSMLIQEVMTLVSSDIHSFHVYIPYKLPIY